MPIPEGATSVRYLIMNSSVENPFEVEVKVNFGGDSELVDGMIEEAADLILARFREAYPGSASAFTSRSYDCVVQDSTWPAESAPEGPEEPGA